MTKKRSPFLCVSLVRDNGHIFLCSIICRLFGRDPSDADIGTNGQKDLNDLGASLFFLFLRRKKNRTVSTDNIFFVPIEKGVIYCHDRFLNTD